MIITIGRQHGSGGSEIGRRLATGLQVPFYDKQALREEASHMGLEQELMRHYGERRAGSLLLSLATGAYSFGYHEARQDAPISQKAYLLAFDVIRRVARRGPCVIVGRCADYALQGYADCINLFIHAPTEIRMAAIAQREGLDAAGAEAAVGETDHLCRSYYNYYSGKSWGEVESYHLTLDSSVLGLEGSAELLEGMLRPYLGGGDNAIHFYEHLRAASQ